MIRHCVIGLGLAALLYYHGRSPADARGEIIPQTVAQRHGLSRPWFAQIRLDRSRGRLTDMVLYEDILYLQTNRATVTALDAETGETLWAKHVGQPNHPSLTPGVSRDLLAIINGSRLYVCNRYNGSLLYETEVRGVPGAGAAVSESWAYVPMIDGMVVAYRLEPITDPMQELGKIKEDPTQDEIATAEEDRREDLRLRQQYVPPLFCQSFGRVAVQPVVLQKTEAAEHVAWPTDRGHLNVGQLTSASEGDGLGLKYRLEASEGIAGGPAYDPGNPADADDPGRIYVASLDGFVHALDSDSGELIWRISTGKQMLNSVVVIDSRVYAATRFGGLYCLDAQSGVEMWWAPRVERFLAASKHRVYASDKTGNILALDAKTGARLDTIAAAASALKLVNTQNDRLYLATEAGLVQCLHESAQVEPLRHGEADSKEAPSQQPPEQQPGVPADAPTDDGGEQVPSDDGAGNEGDPFA